MLWNDIYVSGVGRFLPPRVEVTDFLATGDFNHKAVELADFRSFTAASDITAPRMAARAAAAALRHSGRHARDIAMLAYVSFDEQDHSAPVCHVQRALDAPDALAFELEAGSNGGATGLVVAAGQLRADPSAVATLVVGSGRYLTPRWDRWSPELSVFISDGAAAAVLSREDGFARLVATSHLSVPELETLSAPPDSTAGGTHQRRPMLLETAGIGPYVSLVQDGLQKAVGQVLRESGVRMADVTRVVVSAIGLPQLSVFFFEPLGIDPKRSTWEFGRGIGHVIPCDQLLGLDHLIREGQLSPGDTILVIGVGIGFRSTCVLLEITDRGGR